MNDANHQWNINMEVKVKDDAKAAAWAAYEAITKQRANEAKAKAEADAMRKLLLSEASAWDQARQIREYSAHVLSLGVAPKPEALLEWASWARCVADRIDPALSRLDSLCPVK